MPPRITDFSKYLVVRAKQDLGKPGTEASGDLRPDCAGDSRGTAEVRAAWYRATGRLAAQANLP